MSELVSLSRYGRFFDEILRLDKNIRFIAIHDGKFKAKFQDGVSSYKRENETKSALIETQNKWNYFKKFGFKVEKPKFTLAQYEHLNKITIPFANEGIIFVTTNLDVEIENLVDTILEIGKEFFY